MKSKAEKSSRSHSKAGKILGIVLLCLLVLILAAVVWGGNYLVEFAIGRDSGTTDVAPESTLSDDAMDGIVANWQRQQAQAEQWANASRIEPVTIESGDGLTLSAEAVTTDESSHRWVIAVHGYRGYHDYMYAMASYYGLRGYNALLPDLRACGKSEGDYVGMGWPDRKDMLLWIDWILRRDAQAQIVLHGISMGGATVMMTAGEDLPPQVKAVVEDCGYTSVWDIFTDEMDYLFRLPSFPLLDVASVISKYKAGYSFREADACKQVAKAEVPILFIHGSEDNFVHTDMVYKVYEACASEKRLLVVEGAGHGNSYNFDPELYFSTVFDFLSDYIA